MFHENNAIIMKKSTKTKELQGSINVTRESAGKKVKILLPPVDKAPPPAKLKKAGKAEWIKITDQLKTQGILTVVDLRLIESWCYFCDVQDSCTDELESGLFVATKAGGIMANPAFKIYHDASKIMLTIANNFGLSPTARIKMPDAKENPDDAMTKLMKVD
jgi:P27 family predicted phage terminase small subunit